jgi:iron(III) transport system ATP-binding protein
MDQALRRQSCPEELRLRSQKKHIPDQSLLLIGDVLLEPNLKHRFFVMPAVPLAKTEPQSIATPFLSVRNLTKNFGKFRALDRINLDVMKGEFVCFLGPSGCGKTTLLRAIAGLDLQSEGQVFINGRDVSHEPPALRDFGIVFQSYALFPNLTIHDNVSYGLVNQKQSRQQISDRVAELLELVGLTDQASKYPVQLSGGQQQRVALARALATSPSLLLLDEPLSALDARVRLRLREEIRGLQRRFGVTTIMVTHDQEEALSMADRIVVMNEGLVEQIGTPQEIYGKPAAAFVADFIGRLTMLSGEMFGPNRVKIGGITFDCSDADTLSQGTRVDVALRPESVQLQMANKSQNNRLDAKVLEVEFLGAYSRAKLAFGDANDIICLADFSANVMRECEIIPGQSVSVILPPQALRVFPVKVSPA